MTKMNKFENFFVIEEDIDGVKVRIEFNEDGDYSIAISSGEDVNSEQFSLLKQWINVHKNFLFNLLSTNYLMFGTWCLVKKSIFYDMLPHYFIETNLLDKKNNKFLSTLERSQMLADTIIVSAPILWKGSIDNSNEMKSLIGNSLFKSNNWRRTLYDEISRLNLNVDDVLKNTDDTNLMKGLCIKSEKDSAVYKQSKLIRPNFIENTTEAEGLFNHIRSDVNLWR